MMLRFKSLLSAAAFGVILLASATPASAQLFADDVIHPVEILDYLYGSGYSNVRRPRLRGDVYVVVATDDNGRRVQLAIDAYDGRLLQRKLMGRDPSIRRREDRLDGPRFAEDDGYAESRDNGSSVVIDVPREKTKPKVASKPKVATKAKPKKQVAAIKPEEKGPLVAPGATKPKIQQSETQPVPKPAQPPKLVAIEPPAATTNDTVPVIPKVVLPKVQPAAAATTPVPLPETVAPKPVSAKPRPVQGPPMPPKPILAAPAKPVAPPRLTDSAKPAVTPAAAEPVKPRIIPIAPPADLDAPALPAPPPLRKTPVTPVVGFD
jgi:hypothetical protein